MIVLLIIVIGFWSWTALIAGVLVQRANQRADDADARRFKALELLNEEHAARENDQRIYQARLDTLHQTCLTSAALYRAALEQLTGSDTDDDATPPRVN